MKGFQCAVLGLLLIALSGCEYVDDLPEVSRYMAKNVCAGLYVEGFEENKLINDYIKTFVPEIKNTWRITVDHEQKSVSIRNSIFGSAKARAFYRPPIGCVSPINETDEELLAQAPAPVPEKTLDSSIPWPYGSGGKPADPIPGVQYEVLEQVMDNAVVEEDGINTVALLVVYGGQLVSERYAGGIGPFSPIKGYSMSKSVMNGLLGVLQARGEIDIQDAVGFPEWHADDRANITYEQLMRMTSGLDYQEKAAGSENHQGEMLYGGQPPVQFALSRPLAEEPGSKYNYSSADNVLLAAAVQNQVGGIQSIYELYKTQFFDQFDAVTAQLEHDTQGYMLSAESVFLSARDWARFAYLYMNQGRWNGNQVLSKEWVEYSLTANENYAGYGANIWLNNNELVFPTLPEDTFSFAGALKRFVIAIPSRKTIIVRMGYTHNYQAYDIIALTHQILNALPSD